MTNDGETRLLDTIQIILNQLLESAYSDFNNPITLAIMVTPKRISYLRSYRTALWSPRYAIGGSIHTGLIDEPSYESIIRGGFAHELSHMTKKHLSILNKSLNIILPILPTAELMKRSDEEKETDEDVIRRGLSGDLISDREYLERISPNGRLNPRISNGPYAGSYVHIYYSSHELRVLSQKA